jgi:hypothetical protein
MSYCLAAFGTAVNRENDRIEKIIDRLPLRLYKGCMEQEPRQPKRVGRPPGRRFTDRIEVKIKPADLAALDAAVAAHDMTRAEAVREAVAEWIERRQT